MRARTNSPRLREIAWEPRAWIRNRSRYVGNDVNDLAVTAAQVGLPIAVADALPEVLAASRWTTARPGVMGPFAKSRITFSRRRWERWA